MTTKKQMQIRLSEKDRALLKRIQDRLGLTQTGALVVSLWDEGHKLGLLDGLLENREQERTE